MSIKLYLAHYVARKKLKQTKVYVMSQFRRHILIDFWNASSSD